MASNTASRSVLRGQIPLRPKGSPKCAIHKDQDVIYMCKTCNDLICATCAIKDHKAHIDSLVEIRVIGNEKKEIIQNFVNDTENIKLPQLDQQIKSNKEKCDENARQFQELASKMKQQNEKCKQELDSLTAEYVSTCDKMEKINLDLIKNHSAELQRRHGVLVDLTKECKQVLQSGTNISVFDTATEIQSVDSENQELPPLQQASFIPVEDLVNQLKQAFGTLVTSDDQPETEHPHTATSQSNNQSTSACTKHQTLPVSMTSYKLLETPKELLSRYVPEVKISSLCPLPNGKCWVCHYDSDTISLLHSNGKTAQKVQHHCDVQDISLHPKTNDLWFCCYVDYVGSINVSSTSSKSLVRRFTTEEDPMCLCITNEGHVVVGTWGTWGVQHKVTVYTEDGVVLYMITGKEVGMGRPEKITACPVTGNIALISKDDDGSHIIVFDKILQQKFQYKGEDLPAVYEKKYDYKSRQYKTTGLRKLFTPESVQYDSYGNIIIGDRGRWRMELVSGTGNYVKTLFEYSRNPIGVQKGNILWTWYDSYINQIQYYSDIDR